MLAHLCPARTPRAPELALNAHAAVGPARLDHDRLLVDQALGARDRAAPAREPNPEPAFADFDRDPDDDGDEPPWRREDEDGEQDRDDRGHTGSITAI